MLTSIGTEKEINKGVLNNILIIMTKYRSGAQMGWRKLHPTKYLLLLTFMPVAILFND